MSSVVCLLNDLRRSLENQPKRIQQGNTFGHLLSDWQTNIAGQHFSDRFVILGIFSQLNDKKFCLRFESFFVNQFNYQEPGESAAVEKTNNLFDAESPMFRKAIYTCIGLVAALTICGLIWEFAYWRPRQPKEAKTGE